MKSLMSTVETLRPASIRLAFGRIGWPAPPWLSFLGRWPWLTTPCQSTGVVKGSFAPASAPSAYHTFMIPMTSYHEFFDVSYVEETSSVSPGLSATRQSGVVTVIATSHDTAPAGSKYLASERNSSLVVPARVALRSSYRPPGWRWPPAPISVRSWSTAYWWATPIFARCAPRASSGNV